MARKRHVLKLITVIVSICLLTLLLMNIFNTGRSYHYIHVEKRQQMQQKQQHFQEFLKLDYKASEPSTFELITELETKLPSLPFEYFYRHSNQVMQKFKNCAQYPAIQVLNFFNTYWQTFYIYNSVFQLYGAYYDDRPATGPVVRILAMSNLQHNDYPVIYCQLWYDDDNRPVLTTVKEFKLIWDENWGIQPNVYYPFLLTCEIPKNTNITGDPTPKAINLVQHQCDTAQNSLRIIYNKPQQTEKKQEFAVCVKGLDFPHEDLSARLVEWLELLRLLGVQKVFMHHLQVHANITKVLNFYQNSEFVEVKDVTLVGGVVAQPELEHWLIKGFKLNKRLNELIVYNDCFYRNMYKYNYITLLDIDEIIMPKHFSKTWQDLLTKTHALENHNDCPFAALCAANVYFPTKLPNQKIPQNNTINYMYMLNHAYRLQDDTEQHYYVKCLHNTQYVLTLHNHYPLSHMNSSCAALDLPSTYAQLQHYRDLENNKEYYGETNKFIREDNLERFREPLLASCRRILRELGFLN